MCANFLHGFCLLINYIVLIQLSESRALKLDDCIQSLFFADGFIDMLKTDIEVEDARVLLT